MSMDLLVAGAIGALISQLIGFVFQIGRAHLDLKIKTLETFVSAVDAYRDKGLAYWTSALNADDDGTRLQEVQILAAQKRVQVSWNDVKVDLRESRREILADDILNLIRAGTDEPFKERVGAPDIQRAEKLGAIAAEIVGIVAKERREIFTIKGFRQAFLAYRAKQ